MAELEPGGRVGAYRLEERLGEGGMGVVFRAVHESEGDEVALKVLRAELSADDTFRRRFVHEARAAGEVRHKHQSRSPSDGRPYADASAPAEKSLGVNTPTEISGGMPSQDEIWAREHVRRG